VVPLIFSYRPEKRWIDRSYKNIGKDLLGFKPDELAINLTMEGENIKTVYESKDDENHIKENGVNLYKFSHNITGMLAFDIECSQDIEIYALFDEILVDGDVNFVRSQGVNVLKYKLKQGKYKLQSMEVYTLMYVKFACKGGDCNISNIHVVEYKHPPVSLQLDFPKGNYKLSAIFDAAVETYRQNAVDVFTDCPSRERAGWLCDSFFTSRVEYDLTGKSVIEKNFLENFLQVNTYEFLPDGMLPMCYPADHNDHVFIPNWAMWLVIELEEYLHRSNDRDLIDRYKEKVYKLISYFDQFENSDGLLEKVDGWILLEWSKASDFVMDVNYPFNMTYCGAIKAAANLYNDEKLQRKYRAMVNVIREQSYNGEFFTDHAVRENGKLVNPGDITEVCQYYAFFFDIATKNLYPKLLETMVYDFGPVRWKDDKYPNVWPANAFIGDYLRLDILLRYGYKEKVVEEIQNFFYKMAKTTGTLWEHEDTRASCNHGFASHVIHWMVQIFNKK